MKLLLTSDIHIYRHRDDNRRLQDGLDCLQWIFNTAKDKNVDRVIIAGDLFHDRFLIQSYALSKVARIIKNSNIHTILLLGNHDIVNDDDWNVNSLVALTGELCQVIEKPITLDLGIPIDFLPYTPIPSRYLSLFTPSRVLVSHLAVANAIMNSKYNIKSIEDDSKNRENINVNVFSKWDKVFLGHYHFGQKISENVEYIGSPMQLSFGEADQKKNIILFDTESFKSEYIENTFSPKFYCISDILRLNDIDVKNSYIQIFANDDILSNIDIRKKLENNEIRELEFNISQKKLDEKTSEALKSVSEVINNRFNLIEMYVDNLDNSCTLDKNVLKKIGKDIVS